MSSVREEFPLLESDQTNQQLTFVISFEEKDLISGIP